MSKPRTTRWNLDPHTVGKHRVLKAYLDAWFPILGQAGHPLLFIDGFAGPGRYAGGEDGSPLVALKSFRDQKNASRIRGPVRFLFIEAEEDRYDALKQEIEALEPDLPDQVQLMHANAKFHELLDGSLDDVARYGAQSMAVFCMADPFGMAGIPMSLFRRILDRENSELYITVMQSFIDRFAEQPELAEPLDELFGIPRWRDLTSIEDLDTRRRRFLDLYEAQLRSAGARYVLRFDLFDGKRYVYTLFFATNHIKGCERMKDAIWKVIPDGGFQYRDRDEHQLMLGVVEPPLELMQAQILAYVRDRGPEVLGAHLEHWARGDETPFRCSVHLREATGALVKAGALHCEANGQKAFGKKTFSLPR